MILTGLPFRFVVPRQYIMINGPTSNIDYTISRLAPSQVSPIPLPWPLSPGSLANGNCKTCWCTGSLRVRSAWSAAVVCRYWLV
ncbi:hypothetical protein HYPBUDRAFT_152538 [Hyphopichia burtonii NRRL Y-1933]|uniref:Uncharacterized protein n=1 Tax=Hyphopichia burtonii NRRL Y-1933 TaxID=984485 RepID=A0A1E4RKH2_9ASCO|nr:hypothetical protein HYPBUDRAFT_152538 [Hyphopichia burtonii NRRL Y-1933]ODV67720.1 hypothetical protein HYPBUDRAFT_152538 [Hyphopichia burtonii NRRL Y-1933]